MFDMLFNKLQVKMYYGEKEWFISLGKTIIFVDCYIPYYNVVIEFQGDYWHANPKKYGSEDLIHYKNHKKIKAEEVWEMDEARKRVIQTALDCKVVYIWEMDFVNDNDGVIERLIKEIKFG
jgi:hypothetical protein